MSVSGTVLFHVGIAVALLATPAFAAAQYTGPALLGDSVEAEVAGASSETAAQATAGARTHPFEVWSLGRVAQRVGRTSVVRIEAPSRSPAADLVVSAPGAAPASAAVPGPSAASPPRAAPTTPVGTASPAPARPAGPPASPVAGSRTHRVEWGETWLGIARQYGISDSGLRAANPAVDPERIRSGQVLRIPGSAAAPAQRTHRVAAGETLWGIARRYGVGAELIRSANRLDDDQVRVGQTLVIPGGER